MTQYSKRTKHRPLCMSLTELADWMLSVAEEQGRCLVWNGMCHAGYGSVQIGRDQRRVHKIVAEAKIGLGLPGMVIRHTCDNRACCNPAHLVWGTMQENALDRELRSPRNPRSIFTAREVLRIRDRCDAGENMSEIARELDVTRSTIQAIGSRKTWGWLKPKAIRRRRRRVAGELPPEPVSMELFGP